MSAKERVVAEGKMLTEDFGGSSTTSEVVQALVDALAV